MKVSTLSRATRCAFCHDGLTLETWTCSGCGVVLHSECRAERCPTLGCRVLVRALERPAYRAPAPRDRRPAFIAALSALWLAVSGIAAIIGEEAVLAVSGLTYVFLGAPILAAIVGRTSRERLGGAVLAFALTFIVSAAFVILAVIGGPNGMLGALVAIACLFGPAALAWSGTVLAAEP